MWTAVIVDILDLASPRIGALRRPIQCTSSYFVSCLARCSGYGTNDTASAAYNHIPASLTLFATTLS
jgi:hypothetical protein